MGKAQKVYTGARRFAHRGLCKDAPENTLPAFKAAVDAGCEGIEIDINMSRDGELIVIHDANLTRLTLGHPEKATNGVIARMTWEELSKVELPYANHVLNDFPEGGYENEFYAIHPYRLLGQEQGCFYEDAWKADSRVAGLMRLSELLAWLEQHGGDTMLEIEYKAPGMMPALMALLDKSAYRDKCIVFSGVPAYNEEIQSFCKREGKPEGVKLGANIRTLTPEHKARMEKMDLFEIGLNDKHVSEEDMKYLTDHGIVALSNLGDYPYWWTRLNELGMYGFKTNYAADYTEWWLRNNK